MTFQTVNGRHMYIGHHLPANACCDCCPPWPRCFINSYLTCSSQLQQCYSWPWVFSFSNGLTLRHALPLQAFAQEVATNERHHVEFLRAALGQIAVPVMNDNAIEALRMDGMAGEACISGTDVHPMPQLFKVRLSTLSIYCIQQR